MRRLTVLSSTTSAVTVSAITTLLTPYLIQASDPLVGRIERSGGGTEREPGRGCGASVRRPPTGPFEARVATR